MNTGQEIIAMPLLMNNTNGSTNDNPPANTNVQPIVNDKNNNNSVKVNGNKNVKDVVPVKNNAQKKENNDNRNNVAKRNDKSSADGKNAPRDTQLVGETYETFPSDYTNVAQLPAGNPGYVVYPRYDDGMYPTYGYEIPQPYAPIYCNTSPTAIPPPPGAGSYMPAMYTTRDNVNIMQSIPIYTPSTSTAISTGLANGPNPVSPTLTGLLPIKRKDLLQSKFPINFYARPSHSMDGEDLPSKFNEFDFIELVF